MMRRYKYIVNILFWISGLFLVMQTVKIFIADVCLIPSNSMENVIWAGDWIVVSKTCKNNVRRNDLIIFNHPDGGGTQLIKRCIGLPGDTVLLQDGIVYINSNAIAAPPTVIKSKIDYPLDFPLKSLGWTINNYGPIITPEKGLSISLDSVSSNLYQHIIRKERGEDNPYFSTSNTDFKFKSDGYFVLGDNRDNSIDSRFWGFVPADAIVGKAVMVFFSSDRASKKIRWNRIGENL